MKQMIDKLASLERDIASDKGVFSLFALFLREDAEDTWDLLVSAPWLEVDKKDSLAYLVNQLRSRLDTQELLLLSRIVILEKGNPVLEAIHRAVRVRHGMTEVRDSTFFGVSIKHAYLITSEKENATRHPTSQST
ncbi:MAG: hypothetical protein AB7N91_00885 [Candidatus Tectimicrobiota bacterium]